MSSQFLEIKVLHALVICKLAPIEILVTNLTLDHDFRAVSLNMHEKLLPCQMLEVFMIANITSEFRAVVHCVLLELFQSHPDDLTLFTVFVTLVRELAEVNAILEDLVNWLQEVAAGLTMWAANVISCWGVSHLKFVKLRLLSSLHLSSISFSLPWRHLSEVSLGKFELFWVGVLILVVWLQSGEIVGLLNLDLTIFTEEFVAVFAFQWLIRELQAHHALNLLRHLSLKLILN